MIIHRGPKVAFEEVVGIVKEYRSLLTKHAARRDVEVELEARIGMLGGGSQAEEQQIRSRPGKSSSLSSDGRRGGAGSSFHAATPGLFVEEVCEALQTNSGIEMSKWKEKHDYYWTLKGTGRVRTRCEPDLEQLRVVPSTIQKEKVRQCTFRRGPFLVRVCLSLERRVEDRLLADLVCDPEHVRIQQRMCATVNRHWRYEISSVWSGRTRMDAERRRWSADPDHFVEIELEGGEQYMVDHSDRRVAKSLMLKAGQLIDLARRGGSGGTAGEEQQGG